MNSTTLLWAVNKQNALKLFLLEIICDKKFLQTRARDVKLTLLGPQRNEAPGCLLRWPQILAMPRVAETAKKKVPEF